MKSGHESVAWTAFTILIILVLLALACYYIMPPIGRAPKIELILPNDFSGVIAIRETSHGQPIGTDESSGQYRVNIGPDGTVDVLDVSPFERWHTLGARYDNGTVIPAKGFDDSRDDERAIYSLPTTIMNDQVLVRFFVGTESEYRLQIGK